MFFQRGLSHTSMDGGDDDDVTMDPDQTEADPPTPTQFLGSSVAGRMYAMFGDGPETRAISDAIIIDAIRDVYQTFVKCPDLDRAKILLVSTAIGRSVPDGVQWSVFEEMLSEPMLNDFLKGTDRITGVLAILSKQLDGEMTGVDCQNMRDIINTIDVVESAIVSTTVFKLGLHVGSGPSKIKRGRVGFDNLVSISDYVPEKELEAPGFATFFVTAVKMLWRFQRREEDLYALKFVPAETGELVNTHFYENVGDMTERLNSLFFNFIRDKENFRVVCSGSNHVARFVSIIKASNLPFIQEVNTTPSFHSFVDGAIDFCDPVTYHPYGRHSIPADVSSSNFHDVSIRGAWHQYTQRLEELIAGASTDEERDKAEHDAICSIDTTLSLDPIFHQQEFSPFVAMIFLAQLGRLLHPIGSKGGDRWQLCAQLWGAAGSGKSTVVKMIREWFKSEDIAEVQSKQQEIFGTHVFAGDKKVWLCSEVQGDWDMTPSTLYQIISGETIQTTKKNKDSVTTHIRCNGLIAGNDPVKLCDANGAMFRRNHPFWFNNKPPGENTEFDNVLRQDRGAIMLKCGLMYAHVRRRVERRGAGYWAWVREMDERCYFYHGRMRMMSMASPVTKCIYEMTRSRELVLNTRRHDQEQPNGQNFLAIAQRRAASRRRGGRHYITGEALVEIVRDKIRMDGSTTSVRLEDLTPALTCMALTTVCGSGVWPPYANPPSSQERTNGLFIFDIALQEHVNDQQYGFPAVTTRDTAGVDL